MMNKNELFFIDCKKRNIDLCKLLDYLDLSRFDRFKILKGKELLTIEFDFASNFIDFVEKNFDLKLISMYTQYFDCVHTLVLLVR